jgi:hypothetical protein
MMQGAILLIHVVRAKSLLSLGKIWTFIEVTFIHAGVQQG